MRALIKLKPRCPVCYEEKIYVEDEKIKNCHICNIEFEADSTCQMDHFVCHMCRQKWARKAIIKHCIASEHNQPFPLIIELMKLPEVAIHGPEHHLLLAAAFITAYCNEKGKATQLANLLNEADERSIEVPGGACGFWGICGAAIASGIFMSILTESNPLAGEEWKTTGQLTAQCAGVISREGGPRCCKRDTFLSYLEARKHSNKVLGTNFDLPESIQCEFYPSNDECKTVDCPFFPKR